MVGNQTMLVHQQFNLIVRLMNAALQDDSDIDMQSVAAALLPLACTFGRKLCTGGIQFVYTLIQDHTVWQNLQLWDAAFYRTEDSEASHGHEPASVLWTGGEKVGRAVARKRYHFLR